MILCLSDWYFVDFDKKNYTILLKTNMIFWISIQNWADLCVLHICSWTLFCASKNSLLVPSGLVKKWISSERCFHCLIICHFDSNSILEVWNLIFTAQMIFWWNSFFDWSLRGPGVNFSVKKKVHENIYNTHESAQFWVLI